MRRVAGHHRLRVTSAQCGGRRANAFTSVAAVNGQWQPAPSAPAGSTGHTQVDRLAQPAARRIDGRTQRVQPTAPKASADAQPSWDETEVEMKRILVPTQSAHDWKRLLARPDQQWKAGASAMAAASSWESADGFPPEVSAALESGPRELRDLELLMAIPEWKVPLPGGSAASQTDVLALGTNAGGLVVVAVEAKVDEPLGPTLGEKRADASAGQEERLRYLHTVLETQRPLPDSVRYQLLHRSASAVLTARRFHASAAVMLVQSFSPESRWFEDFAAFLAAMGASGTRGGVTAVPGLDAPRLYLGWCTGDQRHRLPIA